MPTVERMPVGTILSCGHAAPVTDGIGTGYATDGNGRTRCYACADAFERECIASSSVPFVAYVSSDGRTVTTWTGGTLGTVLHSSTFRNGRGYGEQHAYRVRTSDGREWHGRNAGPGMSITLRAATPRKRRDGTRYGA